VITPQRSLTVAAIAITAVVLPLTACHSGSTHHHVSASASAAAKADARNGERILAKCAQDNNTLSGMKRCIAPKGTGLRFKTCAVAALSHGDPLTAKGRAADYGPLGACMVKSR
jgi:hypothetical protein